jgi:hypothetical protein
MTTSAASIRMKQRPNIAFNADACPRASFGALGTRRST